MAFVFDVLDVTGSAIRLVVGDQLPIRPGLDSPVMTSCTGGSGAFAINRVERLVTAGAGQLTSRIAGHVADLFNALRM